MKSTRGNSGCKRRSLETLETWCVPCEEALELELTFCVAAQEDGLLLRDFLRKRGVSSGLLRAVKAQGGFLCRACDASAETPAVPLRANQRVAAGQAVVFALPPEQPGTVTPQTLPLEIVYEDAHTMLLNKPAGQAVHPTLNYADGTLANAFCGVQQQRGTPRPFRPVNRLDRNTSGLVLCAMHAYAAPLLAQSAAKVYYVLVQGVLPSVHGSIDAPLALAEGSIIKRCVAAHGKPARTEYTVLAQADGLSLVRAVPVTGRTHQLRVHFASLGCPLAGDDLYGGSTRLIARHALHCGEIAYRDPASGAPCVTRLPLAQDMALLVRQRLRFSAPEMV